MDGRRWFTRARGGGHRYLSQSCNAKQQPAANHTGCHADIHGYPVIRPGFPTVPGVQGVPIISFLDTLWNGWLIERLVCGNNGCFVSEREEVKSIESGLRALVVRSSERDSKDRIERRCKND